MKEMHYVTFYKRLFSA